MDALRLTLTPQTAFGTPLVGDTLFGHLCWNIAEAYGVARLRDLLDGYTAGAPFLTAPATASPASSPPTPSPPDTCRCRHCRLPIGKKRPAKKTAKH